MVEVNVDDNGNVCTGSAKSILTQGLTLFLSTDSTRNTDAFVGFLQLTWAHKI